MKAAKRQLTPKKPRQSHEEATKRKPPIPSWWETIIPPSLLALFTFLFYYPSLRYPFQFDDIANISKKFEIRFLSDFSLVKLVSPRMIGEFLNKINYHIAGFNPFSYRFFNLLVHILAGIVLYHLIFLVCSRTKHNKFLSKNSQLVAFLTSVLFLLHPVQSQTVSYVIQARLEGLATLFIFITAFMFLKAAYASSALARNLFLASSLLGGALSCGTKEIIIITPVLMILLDWFLIAEAQWDSFKKRLWMHGLLTIVIFGIFAFHHNAKWFTDIFGLQWVTTNNRGNIITNHHTDLITPFAFCISEFKVILHYLLIFIWPFDLSVEYDWILSQGFFAPDAFLPFLLLILIFGGAVYAAYQKKFGALSFGLLWFFVAIAPRSSIIPSSELICDYKTYLASAGILFLIALALARGITKIVELFQQAKPHSFHYNLIIASTGFIAAGYGYICWTIIAQIPPSYKPFASLLFLIPFGILAMIFYAATYHHKINFATARYHLVASLVFIIAIGYGTFERNKVWQDPVSFWQDIVQKAPLKARGHNNLGVALSEEGKFEEAIQYYKHAIELDAFYSDPWSNIAVAYSMTDKTDLAINALQNALRINPQYPEAYNNIGTLFLQKKDTEQAERAFKLALQLRSWYGKAHFNLARLYLDRNENEKAWEELKRATEGDLDTVTGFTALGQVGLRLEKYSEAIEAFKKVIALGEASNDTQFNLANAYFMNNQLDEALTIYERLIQREPNRSEFLYNLGETYFKKERYEHALQAYNQAKNTENAVPQSFFRIADCLEKLNRHHEAKEYLASLCTVNAPEWFLEHAKQELDRFENTLSSTLKTL